MVVPAARFGLFVLEGFGVDSPYVIRVGFGGRVLATAWGKRGGRSDEADQEGYEHPVQAVGHQFGRRELRVGIRNDVQHDQDGQYERTVPDERALHYGLVDKISELHEVAGYGANQSGDDEGDYAWGGIHAGNCSTVKTATFRVRIHTLRLDKAKARYAPNDRKSCISTATLHELAFGMVDSEYTNGEHRTRGRTDGRDD